jgi:hypothetical protein
VSGEFHKDVIESGTPETDVKNLYILCGELHHHRAECLYAFCDGNRNQCVLIVGADSANGKWPKNVLYAREITEQREVNIEVFTSNAALQFL